MPFQLGNSGNQAGRPRGIVDRRHRFRALIEKDMPAIVAKAKELALGGDVEAIKLCFSHTMPKLRDEPPRRALNLGGATAEEFGRSVLAAIADGSLSPDEGSGVLVALGRQGELMRLGVLMDTVAELLLAAGKPLPAELAIRQQRAPMTLTQQEPKE